MDAYWIGLFLGMVSGFGFGRAFEYWISECRTNTPKDKDR
jgi:hypothetical protein